MENEQKSPYGNGILGSSCRNHLKPESCENDRPKAGMKRCQCGTIVSMAPDGKAISE